MIIGILIGIAIVFNWSTIKRVFDGGLGTANANAPAAAVTSPPPASTAATQLPAPAPDAHGDLARATEQRLKDIAAGK
jgi:hypothetical protein